MRLPSYIAGILALSLGLFVSTANAASLDMTTYYPSPTGNYTNLTASNLGVGTLTVNSTLSVLSNVGIGISPPVTNLQVVGANKTIGIVGVGGSPDLANLSVTTNNAAAANVGATFGLGGNSGAGVRLFGLLAGRSEGVGSNGYLSFYTHLNAVGHVERMRITSAGNVGINSTNPLYQLHVNGPVAAQGLSGFSSIGSNPFAFQIRNTAGGVDAKEWTPFAINGNQLISYIANDANSAATTYQIVTRAGNTVSNIDFPNGNIGINSPAPTAKLDVVGPGAASIDLKVNGRIQTGDAGSSGGVWVDNANSIFMGQLGATTLGLYNNGIWGLVLNNNGNVGIGVNPASAKFHVNGEILASNRLSLVDPALGPAATTPSWHIDNSADVLRIFRQPNIGTGGVEFFRINNAGRVSVLSSGINDQILRITANEIYKDITNLAAPKDLYLQTSSAHRSDVMIGNWGAHNAATNSHWLWVAGALEVRETINAGGNIITAGNINAGAYFYPSDKRLKEDIRHLDGALDKILSLEGVTFRWKKDPREKKIGLIAQDVEKVLPEIVHTNENDLKSVDYGNITAVLIEAVKEQQKMIKDLQKKVDALEKHR